MDWGLDVIAKNLLPTVVYSLLGLTVFGLAFWIMGRLAPFSIRKEVEEDQNVALAVLMSSCIIGISIIIAAAIHG